MSTRCHVSGTMASGEPQTVVGAGVHEVHSEKPRNCRFPAPVERYTFALSPQMRKNLPDCWLAMSCTRNQNEMNHRPVVFDCVTFSSPRRLSMYTFFA